MFFEYIIYPLIGWTFLRIKFKNKEERKNVLNQKYAGSYSAAGNILALDGCALVGAISLGIVLITMIGVVIWRLVTQGVDGLQKP